MADIRRYFNRIICNDCALALQKFPDRCIDLVVTSPPYDNLRDYKGYSFDFRNIIKQLFRVVKNGGVVVWIIGDATQQGSETGSSFAQALFFKEIGFNLHDTMIYEKVGSKFPQSNRYYQKFEFMFVFVKGKLKTFNPIRDRRNKGNGIKMMHGTVRDKNGILVPNPRTGVIMALKYGVRGNIWRYNPGTAVTKDPNAFQHPAIFPERLVEDHIISWSNKGEIVLDPFLGSGTTGVVAKRLGRIYIGIEISAEYCKFARQRIDADTIEYSEEDIKQRLFPAEKEKE